MLQEEICRMLANLAYVVEEMSRIAKQHVRRHHARHKPLSSARKLEDRVNQLVKQFAAVRRKLHNRRLLGRADIGNLQELNIEQSISEPQVRNMLRDLMHAGEMLRKDLEARITINPANARILRLELLVWISHIELDEVLYQLTLDYFRLTNFLLKVDQEAEYTRELLFGPRQDLAAIMPDRVGSQLTCAVVLQSHPFTDTDEDSSQSAA